MRGQLSRAAVFVGVSALPFACNPLTTDSNTSNLAGAFDVSRLYASETRVAYAPASGYTVVAYNDESGDATVSADGGALIGLPWGTRSLAGVS